MEFDKIDVKPVVVFPSIVSLAVVPVSVAADGARNWPGEKVEATTTPAAIRITITPLIGALGDFSPAVVSHPDRSVLEALDSECRNRDGDGDLPRD